MNRPHLLAALLLLLVVPRSARADDVDPGHVETCTVEKQARPGEECVLCRAYYRAPDHCPTTVAGLDLTQRCKSAGTSTWREVWCRSAGASTRPITDELRSRLLDPAGRDTPDAAAPDGPPPAKGGGASAAADDAGTSSTGPEPAAPRGGNCGACSVIPAPASCPALAAVVALLVLGARRGATRCSRGRRAPR